MLYKLGNSSFYENNLAFASILSTQGRHTPTTSQPAHQWPGQLTVTLTDADSPTSATHSSLFNCAPLWCWSFSLNVGWNGLCYSFLQTKSWIMWKPMQQLRVCDKIEPLEVSGTHWHMHVFGFGFHVGPRFNTLNHRRLRVISLGKVKELITEPSGFVQPTAQQYGMVHEVI